MNNNNHTKIRIAPFFVFALFLLVALALLTTALTIWIGQLLGCAALGAVIVGGFFLILALVVYLVGMRPTIQRIGEYVENINHAAQIIRNVHTWVTEKTSNILYSVLSGLLRKL